MTFDPTNTDDEPIRHRLKIDIRKNRRDIIRVQESTYHGQEFVDVRTYFQKEGERRPSKSGIMMKPEQARQVARAILDVLATLDGGDDDGT